MAASAVWAVWQQTGVERGWIAASVERSEAVLCVPCVLVGVWRGALLLVDG